MNAPIKTGLTHAGTAIGGAVAAVAFLAQHQVDLYAAWNQLNAIVAEITKFIALVTPLFTAAYGIYRSTTKNRLAEIANDPKAVEAAKEMPVTPATTALSNALVKSVLLALVITALLHVFTPGRAEAQTRIQQGAQRNDVNRPGGIQAVSPLAPASDSFDLGGSKISDAILGKIMPDLRYAAALSKQNNNKITQPCLSAVLALADSWNVEVKDDKGNVLPLPNPHVITFLEKQSQLLRQLQPDSDISLGCSGMAQALRKDVASLVGAILSGGALGIFKLPVLPIP